MKTILPIITAMVIVASMWVLSACESEPRGKVNYINSAEQYLVPEGAQVIDILRNGTTPEYTTRSMYVVFMLNNQCFITYAGDRRRSMANYNCPK